jgi:ribose/xylose/arabinose/galactoside ABC-type transport system permease subunit
MWIAAKNIVRRYFGNENAVLSIVLVVLIAIMGVVTKGLTLSRVNANNVLLQSSIRGIAAVGQAFVILSANIDISVGGVGLVCAALGARALTQDLAFNIFSQPATLALGVAIMMLAGAAFGAINGTLSSRIGMPSLIVTLGMWQITNGIGFRVTEGRSISQLPESLTFYGSGTIGGIPVPVIIFIVVAVIAYFILNHTVFGRSVYATGGNPVSAWLSSINVKGIQLAVFIISGFCAGLTGVILTARVMSASMRSLEGLEIDSIAAVTVGGLSLSGGKGSIIGAVLGVIIIGTVNNGMSVLGADPAVQGIVKGVIIITAVATDYLRRRGR